MTTNTARWDVNLSWSQELALVAWGAERGLTSKTDIVRALAREVIPDLPPDPAPPGGYREARRPLPGEQVRVKRDTDDPLTGQPIRAGYRNVVERTTRRGVVVMIGIPAAPEERTLRYRDIEVVPFGE